MTKVPHVEWVDIVDEQDRVIGVAERARVRQENLRHRASYILVLDEATSALDSEVEAAIQSNLERLMRGIFNMPFLISTAIAHIPNGNIGTWGKFSNGLFTYHNDFLIFFVLNVQS